MANTGGGANNKKNYNTTNTYNTSTQNKSTPIGTQAKVGPAVSGYKSTITVKSKQGGGKTARAAVGANEAVANNAIGFARSAGKAEISLLSSATGQIIALAGKKIQTATQAATGTAPTQSSKTIEYVGLGLLAVAAIYVSKKG